MRCSHNCALVDIPGITEWQVRVIKVNQKKLYLGTSSKSRCGLFTKKLVANGAHAVCLQKYFEVEVDIVDGRSSVIWHR